jgi:hypothetical protein
LSWFFLFVWTHMWDHNKKYGYDQISQNWFNNRQLNN